MKGAKNDTVERVHHVLGLGHEDSQLRGREAGKLGKGGTEEVKILQRANSWSNFR